MTVPPNKGSNDLLTLSSLILGLGALIVVVSLFGSDVNLARIIQYFSSAVPIIIGFAFMHRKQEANDEKTEETRKNVGYLSGNLNGHLDKRFSDLERTIVSKVDSTQSTVAVDPEHGDIVIRSGEVNDEH